MTSFTGLGRSSLRTAYIGNPGAMSKMLVPDNGLTFPLTRGATAHTLIDGGVSSTKRRHAKRANYPLTWSNQTPDDADLPLQYYLGAYGEGPFCLIDPAWRNLMNYSRSNMGVQLGAIDGWSAGVSSVAPPTFSTAVVGPVVGSGVMALSTYTSGQYLFEGTQAVAGTLVPDVASATSNGTAVPYVVDQPYALSVYGRCGSGTVTGNLTALGCPATGWRAGGLSVATAVTLTTAWQRFYVGVASGAWNPALAPYVCTAFQPTATSSSNPIYLAAASTRIGVPSPDPDGWVTGMGVPRGTVQDPFAAGVTIWDRRSQTLVFAEG